MKHKADLDLTLLLEHFQKYLNGILLDEEAISCGFLLADMTANELEIALFGFPPLLLRNLDGTIRHISGANPPLCTDSNNAIITRLSLEDVADIMLMTDGITDATIPDGRVYRERVEDDFRTSPTIATMLQLFSFHTDQCLLDDMTLLHLQRLDLPGEWEWRGEMHGVHLLEETAGKFISALGRELPLDQNELGELETLLTETLTNAAVHGCSRDNASDSNQVTPSAEQGQSPAGVRLRGTLWKVTKRPLLIIEVIDNGPGISPEQLRKIAKGSGLGKIWCRCDSFFGGPGSSMLLLKTMGGLDYAN